MLGVAAGLMGNIVCVLKLGQEWMCRAGLSTCSAVAAVEEISLVTPPAMPGFSG